MPSFYFQSLLAVTWTKCCFTLLALQWPLEFPANLGTCKTLPSQEGLWSEERKKKKGQQKRGTEMKVLNKQKTHPPAFPVQSHAFIGLTVPSRERSLSRFLKKPKAVSEDLSIFRYLQNTEIILLSKPFPQ